LKVALAYSGGLDTSIAIRLLQKEYDADVITVSVNVGQSAAELKEAAKKAEQLGVIKHYEIDAVREFVEKYVFKCIKANGLYEGYPLSTAIARYPIAMPLLTGARERETTSSGLRLPSP